MSSSLNSQEQYDKQGHIIVVGGSYLKRFKKVKILFRVDVADGRIARQNLELSRGTRRKDLKPDNVVHTQSIPISQEGIATQELSRDSDQRVSTNYTQLTILRGIEKVVVRPATTSRVFVSLLHAILLNCFIEMRAPMGR